VYALKRDYFNINASDQNVKFEWASTVAQMMLATVAVVGCDFIL
jgi:hypothetical protein